jgi:hypothetical protein
MLSALRNCVSVALLTLTLLPPPAIAAVNARPVAFAAVITGRITDKETGQPIVAAQVAVTGSTRVGAVSDNSGNYTLRGAPAGQVTLRVTRIGYQPVEQSVTVPADGSVTANFSLAHAVARLAEVIGRASVGGYGHSELECPRRRSGHPHSRHDIALPEQRPARRHRQHPGE